MSFSIPFFVKIRGSVGADYIHCTGEETTHSLQPTWGLVRLTARVSRGKNTVFLLRYRFSLYT
ncbi:hypothetical protein L208DRAFT_1398558 [Tricholoma matsutake]|nr:hypothetical protein L208DRAFT_1398558 [Tricholoma matsutake 945]